MSKPQPSYRSFAANSCGQGGSAAYNFPTNAYHACFGNVPDADVKTLRQKSIEYINSFDRQKWINDPVQTMINGNTIGDGKIVDTVDAFGRVNGKQVLSPPHVVDQVIGHMRNYKAPRKDYRAEMRAIDWRFMTVDAPEIVGNQAIDFEKQDGITEIEEAIQANCVEQRLNDSLLEAELNREVVIRRDMVIVGAVSNFTNFLDLCRKSIRHIELGVPVVVFSRSNTTQHVYRWTVMLSRMCKEFGVDAGMVSFLSCSIDEQRRVMQACQSSPMHFTGSRDIAKKIKEVCPMLIASTGGPNTLVADQYNDAVGNAVRWSNLIENKGQCTALRHFVCPGVDSGILESMYGGGKTPEVSGAAESLAKGEFAGIMSFLTNDKPAPGYQQLKANGKVNAKISPELPPLGINEQWRQIYIDVTSPAAAEMKSPEFLKKLAQWLNYEQPITLAINSGDGYVMADRLFETTGLCVYTVGDMDKPGLTAQARPQEGEVFGEFPPRRMMNEVTALPMLNPTPCAGYNTVYDEAYLEKRGGNGGQATLVSLEGLHIDAVRLLSMFKRDRMRGYANILLEYLLDATQQPKPNFYGRTSLFGLQRTPMDGSRTILRCENESNADLLLLYSIVFAATNAFDSVEISVEGSSKWDAAFLQVLGKTFPLGLTNELHDTYMKRKQQLVNDNMGAVYNEVLVDAPMDCLLAFQFISRLFPLGHIKSTKCNDHDFINHFSKSPKWLQCRGNELK